MKSVIYKEKLVAFALGELNECDAAEIKAILAKDADAAKFVEEVRSFSRFAEQELGKEPMPMGGGSLPILKKIVLQQERNRMSHRQVWAQAAVLGLLVVLFFVAFPLRKKFGGNVSQMVGSLGTHTAEKTDTATEDGQQEAPVKRKARENPSLIERDLDELDSRAFSRFTVQRCRISLPARVAADKNQLDPKSNEFSTTFFLAETSAELTVKLNTRLQPMARELDFEEIEHDEYFTLFRKRVSESELVFFKVPARSHLPVCVIGVELEGNFSEAAKKRLGEPLEAFARRLVDSANAQ